MGVSVSDEDAASIIRVESTLKKKSAFQKAVI
jgi:hypothetical protein